MKVELTLGQLCSHSRLFNWGENFIINKYITHNKNRLYIYKETEQVDQITMIELQNINYLRSIKKKQSEYSKRIAMVKIQNRETRVY